MRRLPRASDFQQTGLGVDCDAGRDGEGAEEDTSKEVLDSDQ